MRFRSAALVLALLPACAPTGHAPQETTAAEPAPAGLAAELERLREETGLPGLAVLRRDPGQPDLAEAVGVRRVGDAAAMTAADVFHFGSNGKTLTATLAALLVAEGRLAWDTPLGTLLPDVTMRDEYRGVPFGALLSHRARLPEVPVALHERLLTLDARAGRTLVAAELLALPPPDAATYSNAGYMLAGAMLERVAGQDFEALLATRLLQPLGMASCGFGPVFGDQPWGHDVTSGTPVPVPPGPEADNPPAYGPAGRVHCALADWMKLMELHAAGARGEATPLLDAAAFAYLHALPEPDAEFTNGGWVTGDFHGARFLAMEGCNTLNDVAQWIFPASGRLVLAATNAGDAPRCDLVSAIVNDAVALTLKAR